MNKKAQVLGVFFLLIIITSIIYLAIVVGAQLRKDKLRGECFDNVAKLFCEQQHLEIESVVGYGFECSRYVSRYERESSTFYFSPEEIKKCEN